MNSARRAGATTVATLTALALSLAAAHLLAPGWVRSVGLDVWSVIPLQEQLESANRKQQVLAGAIAESDRRTATKATLIDHLLNGRMKLREVAAGFLALNRDHPAFMMTIRLSYAGATDLEKSARNVLDYAARQLRGARQDALVLPVRLSNEFQEWFGTTYTLSR